MRLTYQPSEEETSFRFRLTREDGGRGISLPVAEPLAGRASVRGGLVVIEELTLRGEDLTSGSLRQIPLGEIRAQIQRDLLNHPELLSWQASLGVSPEPGWPLRFSRLGAPEREEARRRTEEIVATLGPNAARRGGGRRRNDGLYREIAERYLEALRTNPKDPIVAMAKAMARRQEWHGLSEETVRAWVRRARSYGWLSKGQQGKAGADPGPLLLAARAEQTDEPTS